MRWFHPERGRIPPDVFIPVCEDCGTYRYLNPGSVSIPKNDTPHSYMTWEDGTFLWRELESGAVYKSFQP